MEKEVGLRNLNWRLFIQVQILLFELIYKPFISEFSESQIKRSGLWLIVLFIIPDRKGDFVGKESLTLLKLKNIIKCLMVLKISDEGIL